MNQNVWDNLSEKFKWKKKKDKLGLYLISPIFAVMAALSLIELHKSA